MDGKDIGSAIRIGEVDRDCHLTAERGICCLELVRFDDLLVW